MELRVSHHAHRLRREGGAPHLRPRHPAEEGSTSSGSRRTTCPKFYEFIARPTGIILVTGPTGSGKTTTLYSVLKHLSKPEVNIVTIEDPIEMVFEDFNQVPVRPADRRDLRLAALRTVLRQDPDIIMVGEIRDTETADHAVQAALTGHLVLSTLHTNDAPSSITRLLDLERPPLPDHLHADRRRGAAAGARELHALRRGVRPDARARRRRMKIPFEKLKPYRFRRGKGCLHCRETGYLGRTGIYEILPMSEKIRRLVSQQASSLEIFKAAREEGLRTLKEAAIEKVFRGVDHHHRDDAGHRQMNDDGLRGRVFLVTGSGRGLGRALACAAGAEKARVVVNTRRDERAAEAVAAEVQKAGGEAIAVRADVTDFEEARVLVDRALSKWGRIDVLVNTVGRFHWNPLVEMEPPEWRRIVATNLDSVFHMCRLVVPHMRERRFGRIVNLAAVGAAGTQGEPQMTAYGAAKAGVVALSRALALEEARCGITVNVVSPGLLKDESGDKVAAAADAMLGDRVPVGHAGDAADVVRAVLFFASPAADFVTGQVVEVAGGARL